MLPNQQGSWPRPSSGAAHAAELKLGPPELRCSLRCAPRLPALGDAIRVGEMTGFACRARCLRFASTLAHFTRWRARSVGSARMSCQLSCVPGRHRRRSRRARGRHHVGRRAARRRRAGRGAVVECQLQGRARLDTDRSRRPHLADRARRRPRRRAGRGRSRDARRHIGDRPLLRDRCRTPRWLRRVRPGARRVADRAPRRLDACARRWCSVPVVSRRRCR